jgi:hypothetical protein
MGWNRVNNLNTRKKKSKQTARKIVMPVSNYDLCIPKGSTFRITVEVRDDTNTAMDLGGYSARSSIRPITYRGNIIANFSANILSPVTDGKIELSLTHLETDAIVAGRYVYDVEIYNETSVYRILEGNVLVTNSATYD